MNPSKKNITIIGVVALFVGMLMFLWQPLLQEERLGLISRLRRKITISISWAEPMARKILFLPEDSNYRELFKEVTNGVRKDMVKSANGEDDDVIDSAVSVLLYLRTDSAGAALPVNPEESPLEIFDDLVVNGVSLNPELRHRRNVLLENYLGRNSKKSHEKLVAGIFKKERKKLIKRSFNPFRYVELALYESRTVKRIGLAIDQVENHLDNAGGTILATLNPEELNYDSTIAMVDVESKGFSSVSLEELKVVLLEPLVGELMFFRDENGNGVFDNTDRFIGEFGGKQVNKNGELTLEILGMEELVFAAVEEPAEHGVDPYWGRPLFAKNNRSRFFIKSVLPLNIIDIKPELSNAISGKKINSVAVRFVNDETFRYRLDMIASPEEFAAKHPQFILQNSHIIDESEKPTVLLQPGKYTFYETVVVPETVVLRLLSGTTFRFMPGVSLVSYAPILAQAAGSSPIRFLSATGEPWGTFGIVNTKKNKSVVSNIVVENAGPAMVNGIIFSGGLAAHYADIEITDSIFRNNHGDDGVNVKYSWTRIEGNQFINNDFDGLDLDVSRGEVTGNVFSGNGNDGMDVSWNEAVILNNVTKNNGDKCISVGEKSTAPITGNTIEGCAMGVAVKDLSDVVIEGNVIRNNKQGVAIYQKKPIFGGGKATLKDNIFERNEQDVWADDVSEIVK